MAHLRFAYKINEIHNVQNDVNYELIRHILSIFIRNQNNLKLVCAFMVSVIGNCVQH